MPESAPPSSAPAGSQPPNSSGSAVRLLVLIGLLALAVFAWYYDYSFAGPGSEAKYEAILKMVAEKNAMGVKSGGIVRSKDVQDVVGFAPTYVQKEKDYTVEWYCWWGKIPVLTTWKRYITVVYTGEPLHFNTHHKNEPPPAESLPNYQPPETSAPSDGPVVPVIPGGDLAGGMKGGADSGKSKKSGNGDAAPPGDKPAEGAPSESAPPPGNKPAEGDKPADSTTPKAPDAPKAEDKPAE